MTDNTRIEWTDATWNPVTGCTKVSPGCDHCYAETLAERFRGTPGHYFEQGFDVVLRPDKLDQPLRWKRPRRIFVNSMSDLFHDQVPDDYIARVFAVMALAPHHTFQVLTKRHGRMRSLLNSEQFRNQVKRLYLDCDRPDGLTPGRCSCGHANSRHNELAYCLNWDCLCGTVGFRPWDRWPLPNVWLGVSVENQQWADIRIPALLDTPAAVRFLSCEPLLGPVSLDAYLRPAHCEDCAWTSPHQRIPTGGERLHWVIVGGESGRGARPMHLEWARSLRDQCTSAEVPFLFKQWGEFEPVDRRDARPGDYWVLGEGGMSPVPWTPESAGAEAHRWGPHMDLVMRRVGKKAAGRDLDRRTWDEFPAATAATTSEGASR